MIVAYVKNNTEKQFKTMWSSPSMIVQNEVFTFREQGK